MSDEYDRDFGRMEAQVKTLEAEVADLRDDVKAIRTMLDQAQGGWKFMMASAGLIGALGGLMGKFLAVWAGWLK